MKNNRYDAIVIGSGIAGLFYALQCAEFCNVLLITKSAIGESNTMYAQGGIAAVTDRHDSIESHITDTLTTGDGLCDETAVNVIATQAPDVIRELVQLKVRFNLNDNGEFNLHREGGHSKARVVHYDDATGREVETRLVTAVLNNKNITILENHFVIDLIVHNNTCYGVTALPPNSNKAENYFALITMLAAGGVGQVYARNTNPAVATGDGFAMAYRAGAELRDMEFVQFHPTTLYSPKGGATYLITEAIRGFGAELKNLAGESFMANYHPMKSLAPRDIATRAIILEMQKSHTNYVFLDLREFDKEEIRKRFPNIFERCLSEGLNLKTDMIPITPAAHYMCGGITTDILGRTSIKNLYACGEVAGAGIHGANRLASNSLLEGLVFAKTAAKSTKKLLTDLQHAVDDSIQPPIYRISSTTSRNLAERKKNLQNLMWNYAGIIRSDDGLEYCFAEITDMRKSVENELANTGISKEGMELLNMLDCSAIIVYSALNRKESRGCHYRSDYPKKLEKISHTVVNHTVVDIFMKNKMLL